MLGDYNTAFAIALQGQKIFHGKYKRKWDGHVVMNSYIDIEKYEEAEHIYGDQPEKIKEALRDIGSILMDNEKYHLASIYYSRYLSYCSLPREAMLLVPYIQSLMMINNYNEASNISRYWINHVRDEQILGELTIFASGALWKIGSSTLAVDIFTKHYSDSNISIDKLIDEDVFIYPSQLRLLCRDCLKDILLSAAVAKNESQVELC